MKNIRIESDSMGKVEVPSEALYAAQTQRAVDNFPISSQTLPESFIRALLLIKAAAAQANSELEQIPEPMGIAIQKAVEQLLTDEDLMHHFPVDIYQTGSGTSSNMNANEVLATIATNILGEPINPNDHINCSQSSNDVIPTAIHVSASLELTNQLIPALTHLIGTIKNKAKEMDTHVKT